jgi:hypothetical protein
MGGGLMQLVAYGAQDVYLSGNPQITFFKVVYRRHTNFSVEPIPQTWNGAADFGRTVSCDVSRNGDLIGSMYVVVQLASKTPDASRPWGYVNRLGHALLESVKVEIGGSKIDEQYGDWLNIWYELTHKTGQERGYAKMIGDLPELKAVNSNVKPTKTLHVPLQFWFNRNNGLALPLIALQYHQVRMTAKFREAAQCVNYNLTAPTSSELPSMSDCYLLIDYFYLDSEERKRFAQSQHEYLIEQLQFTGAESLPALQNKYRLNFNHPSKFLVWAPHLQRYNQRESWVSYAHDGDWAAARDRMAKVIAAAASTGLNVTDTASEITATAPNATTIGDLVEPVRAAVGGITSALLNKVEVKFVAKTAVNADAAVRIASSAADLLDNAIVTRNELTMEDLSLTLSQLRGSLATNAEAYLLLGFFEQQVVNHFNYGNMVDGSDNPVSSCKLQLNGHDRFQTRDGEYFNYVQPHQHFSNTPADGINVYSFALKPEDHQPSGTCNFSRIDNTTLNVSLGKNNEVGNNTYLTNFVGGSASNSIVNIFDVNYNVLRVMSGMGGLAYSN